MTFEEKRRAAFEEWFRKYYSAFTSDMVDSFLIVGGNGIYHDADTEDMWQAWQAALEWSNKVESE